MKDVLFVSWVAHRRTREICMRLQLPLVELISKDRGVVRYAKLLADTCKILWRRRPGVVLVQSPSIVLALSAVLLRPFLRFLLVMDAHNEAVEPYLHPTPFVRALTHWLLRKADRVIVTNSPLATFVRSRSGQPIVLPDPLPSPPSDLRYLDLGSAFRVAVIATFAEDEPVDAILGAAARLGPSYQFYVTGNSGLLSSKLRSAAAPNVTFTGYLSEHDYWNLIHSCDAVMDLTLMPNCLVCGAYEAAAVEKPLLLSDNGASADVFSGLGEFVDNTPTGIAAGLERLRENLPRIQASFAANRCHLEERWNQGARELTEFIASRAG